MLRLIGARITGFRPETVFALIVCNDAFRDAGHDCIVRFGIDGKHSRGSEHYTGLAFDLRMHHVPQDKRPGIVKAITDALGPDFDVIWEAVGTPNEHLHVEFDPKEPY